MAKFKITRLCKDCHHCMVTREREQGHLSWRRKILIIKYRCVHPVLLNKVPHLITGSRKVPSRDCILMRTFNEYCGSHASYYEARR